MAGGLEDLVWGESSAVELEHVLLEDEVLAPDLNDVGLEGATWWAVVEETGDTIVDLERWSVEETASQQGVKGWTVEGLALEGGSVRHFDLCVLLLLKLELRSVRCCSAELLKSKGARDRTSGR